VEGARASTIFLVAKRCDESDALSTMLRMVPSPAIAGADDLLDGKAGGDLVERRPRPILRQTRRPADVNEAGDALVRL
jgi:hypothetical protein